MKISLEARNEKLDESAAITIEIEDPEEMVDKVLSVLSARFPIGAFYRVLGQKQELIREVCAQALTSELEEPTILKQEQMLIDQTFALGSADSSETHQRALALLPLEVKQTWLQLILQMHPELISSISESHLALVAQQLAGAEQPIPNQKSKLDQSSVQLLAATQLETHTQIDSVFNTHLETVKMTVPQTVAQSKVTVVGLGGVPVDRIVSMESDFSEAEVVVVGSSILSRHAVIPTKRGSIETASLSSSHHEVFADEGKWETVDEAELLADKDTEHSKSGSVSRSERSKKSGSSSLSAAYMARLHSIHPLIQRGLQSFPVIFAHFVLSIPPQDLAEIISLSIPTASSQTHINTLAQQLHCNPVLVNGLVEYAHASADFNHWCQALIQISHESPVPQFIATNHTVSVSKHTETCKH